MTWGELKNFINKRARNNKDFLDHDVNLYDFSNGEEYRVNITELSCGEDEAEDGNITNWVAYLSINEEDNDENNSKTKETSFN